jgi:predicted nucleic acid-binding protein
MVLIEITREIDIDDIDFVALTSFLKATLWTGTKLFTTGLKNTTLRR